MPSVMLSSIFSMRLEAISFFLLIFIVSVFFIKYLWNNLAKTFPKLPAMGLKQAFIFTFALALLFNIVLLMISGARELLTPGAWQEKGHVYELKKK